MKPRGALAWLFHRVSGVMLIAGLTVHFTLMHFSGPDMTSYESVIERLQSPQWIVFNSLFLLAAIYHGFHGLWGIAVEYIRNGQALLMARGVIVCSAVVLLAAGLYILALS